MKYFKDIDAIRNAGPEELVKADGMTVKAAESVYAFFH